ncbi:uncharacterized protein LOC106665990 isoform X2 [Cimex lectularius]|uniref:Uncharacterized protein n=1 Tax=Cimex lectularius TaxID=79782 RepID=A0A8I6TE11_CIMLE|nr:uncharacterized protein LOC106665990 isoform X2 [Cimex lectularius]
MDKQQEAAQADSISTVGVNIKVQEYPPSEVYTSEPPPAYVRPRGTAVQIAKIAAVTLVAVSVILGFFMVATAYVSASVSCYQDYPAPQDNIEDRPSYQHLVDPLDSEESSQTKRESVVPPALENAQTGQEQPVQIKLPLMLNFDELAGSIIEKNQRSRMNCVVEKRRTEEVMDHQPKTVNLPFGVNLKTDPRLEHVTGERMAIFCESGNDQRNVPVEQQMPMMIPIQVHQMPIPHPNEIPHHVHHIPQGHQVHPMFHQAIQHQMQHEMVQHPQEQQVHLKFPPQIPHRMMPEGQVIIQEEVIPVFQPHPRPEGRSLEHHPVEVVEHPVPSDTVKPPPPPAFTGLPMQDRPHFVQPRSIRSVNSLLKRDKRVRRCACDCAC